MSLMNKLKVKESESNKVGEAVWEEDRIFLFIDLNNSTHLAEKLGNKLFSYLITQCVADIYPILHKYSARLYHIVGDEIVLSWLRAECKDTTDVVHLFFDFENQLRQSAEMYERTFGVVPIFKATCHLGKVAVSSDIFTADEPVYRGNVLNTCGGLFKLCRVLNKPMIVTEAFVNSINTPQYLNIQNLGRYLIKGKLNYENVFGVERRGNRL
jgi:adenylate cyclase